MQHYFVDNNYIRWLLRVGQFNSCAVLFLSLLHRNSQSSCGVIVSNFVKCSIPYLFEYNAQNFVLIFNQKLWVRVTDANCKRSTVLEIC